MMDWTIAGPIVVLVLSSSVVAAVVTGVFNVFARRSERSHARQIISDERTAVREDRKAEHGRTLELESMRRQLDDDERRKSSARAAAAELLPALEELEEGQRLQGPQNPGATYNYDGQRTQEVRRAIRRIPDPAFREFATLSIQVINETWVSASVGNIDGDAAAYQREVLQQLVDQTTSFAHANSWDESLMTSLHAAKDSIDSDWAEFHDKAG